MTHTQPIGVVISDHIFWSLEWVFLTCQGWNYLWHMSQIIRKKVESNESLGKNWTQEGAAL